MKPSNVHFEGRQAALKEDPMPPVDQRRCAWCGEKAEVERALEPERCDKDGKTIRPPRTVHAAVDTAP